MLSIICGMKEGGRRWSLNYVFFLPFVQSARAMRVAGERVAPYRFLRCSQLSGWGTSRSRPGFSFQEYIVDKLQLVSLQVSYSPLTLVTSRLPLPCLVSGFMFQDSGFRFQASGFRFQVSA